MIIINALKELNLYSWIINFKYISPVLLLQLKLLMDIQHISHQILKGIPLKH